MESVTLDTNLGDPKKRVSSPSDHDSLHDNKFSPQADSIDQANDDGKTGVTGNKGSIALFSISSLDQIGE